MLVAGAASAQAVLYEGKIKGQPSSTVKLTFVKEDGKRFLDDAFLDYTTTCEPGPTSQSTNPDGRPRVRDGHFKHVTGSPDSNEFFRLVGDLKRGGKATGDFRLRTYAGPTYGVCDTGHLEWVAFKQ